MDSFLLRSYTYIMHFISFTIIQQLVLAYKYIRIRLNLLEIFANSSFIFMSSASSLIIRKKKKKNIHGAKLYYVSKFARYSNTILPWNNDGNFLEFTIQILHRP